MEEVENGDEDEGVAGDNEEVDREEKMAEEEEEELVKQLLKQWSHTLLIMQIPRFCGRHNILIIRRLASSLSAETRAPRRKAAAGNSPEGVTVSN